MNIAAVQTNAHKKAAKLPLTQIGDGLINLEHIHQIALPETNGTQPCVLPH